MADIVDTKTRSRMMASIKRKDTQPEQLVRRYLHATGLRFRLHDTQLAGTPDLVLPKFRTAVFVNGCFWHRHAGCKYTTTPSTRVEFWAKKFASNVARDRETTTALRRCGWRVLTIWECEAQDELAIDRLFWSIVAARDD
jgi:DNA mismatch endonuclease, patch repair protein